MLASPWGGSPGIALLFLCLFLLMPIPGITGHVISLYDATGHATAYIAEDGTSIYLYAGKLCTTLNRHADPKPSYKLGNQQLTEVGHQIETLHKFWILNKWYYSLSRCAM